MDSEPRHEQRERPADIQLQNESWALWLGLIFTVVGIGVGLVAFAGYRPGLAGDRSVALHASAVAALAATVGSIIGYNRVLVKTQTWLLDYPLLRQVTNSSSLVILHASISAMAALTTFRVFQNAFIGLTVERYAGGVMVGVCAGIAGYVSVQSAARVTARSLSTLLAVFMAGGVFISMLAAENPLWWKSMFSELGTGSSGQTSFWSFNFTLVVSGLVLSTLTAFIVRDLKLIAAIYDENAWALGREPARFMRPRPGVVRACLLGIGACSVGIGLIPVSVALPVHSTLSRIAGCFILVLLLGAVFWLPGFPWIFHVFTFVCVLGLAGAGYLWQPLNYYNLTAFELAVVGIVFGWLAVFIRTTAAVLAVKQAEPDRVPTHSV